MQEQDDDALVKAANAGDSSAFAELVGRYEDRLYRIARTMLFNDQMAADAVQESFLRAFRGINGFRFRASVYTWLYAILRNVCRELNRQGNLSGTGTASNADGIENLLDSGPGPDEVVNTAQQLEDVMTVIKTLPERQREVFVLRILEGLSVEQTATLIKCRPGTVKTHLHRAMRVIHASKKGG